MMSTVYSVDLKPPKPNIVCQRCTRKQAQAKVLSRVGKKNSSSHTAEKIQKTPSDLIYLIPFYRSLRQDEKWRELRKKLDQDQTKKLVQWINNNLANSYRITNLYIDLSDGLRVTYLIEVLYNCHLNKESPITRLHKMKNFQTCIDFMEFSRQVKCIGINSTELVNGNLKILLGFLFLIRHDYEYKYCREILTMSNERISELKTVPQNVSKNDNEIQKIVQNSEIKDKLERVDSLPNYQESLKSESKSSVFSSDLDENKSVEQARNINSYRLVNGSYDSLESDDKFSNVKSGLSSKSMSDIESIPNSSQTDSLVDLMSNIQKVSAEMKNKLDNCLKELSNSEKSIDTEDDNYPNSELSKFEETMKESNNGFNETEIFEQEGSVESIEPRDFFTKSPLFETNQINNIPSQHKNIVNTNLLKIQNKKNSNSNEQIVPIIEELIENDDQVLPVRTNLSDDEIVDMMERNESFQTPEQKISCNFNDESIPEKESTSTKLVTKNKDSFDNSVNKNSSEYLNKDTCEIMDKKVQDLDDFKKELKEIIEPEKSKDKKVINGHLTDLLISASSNIEPEKSKDKKVINGHLTDLLISASSSLANTSEEELNDEALLSNKSLNNIKENVTHDGDSLCDFSYQNNNDRIEKILFEKEQILDEGNISESDADVKIENNEKSSQILSEKVEFVQVFNQVIDREHQNLSDNDTNQNQNFAEKFSNEFPLYNPNENIIESMMDSLKKEVSELSNLNGNIVSKITSDDFAKLNPDDQSNQSEFIFHKIEDNFEKEYLDPKSTKYNYDKINCENIDPAESTTIKFDEGTSKNIEKIDRETFQDELDSDKQTSPKFDLDIRIDQQKDSDTVYHSLHEKLIMQTYNLLLDLNKEEEYDFTNLNEKLPGFDQFDDISVENSAEQTNEPVFLEKDENSCVHRITDQNSKSNEEDSNETDQNDNEKETDIIDKIISGNDNKNEEILATIDPPIDQNGHEFSQHINSSTDEKKCTDCLSSQEYLNQIESLTLNNFTLDDSNNVSDLYHNSFSKHSKHESENLTSIVEKSFENEILDESIDEEEQHRSDNSIREIEVMPKNNITYSNSEHSKKTYSSIVQQNYNEKPLEKNSIRSNENEKLEQKNSGQIKYKQKSASKQDFGKSKIKNITNKPVYEECNNKKFSSKPLVKKLDSETDRSVETKNKFKELENIDLHSNLENDSKSSNFFKSNGTINSNGKKNKNITRTNSIIFSQSDDFKTPCKDLNKEGIWVFWIVARVMPGELDQSKYYF
ncbi:hypothetical protein BpHYR1_044489 [Brachionus plicatilis]|uniref:Calponin-homology (CH) domain-containing protein n=1 Tax=Brachionus plicatilis TaxID=10195 RepID=A0A3M7SZ18_BRAPC|nr:hypothetical protein BpHYR1_044489 [Brachionus plicatilis]